VVEQLVIFLAFHAAEVLLATLAMLWAYRASTPVYVHPGVCAILGASFASLVQHEILLASLTLQIFCADFAVVFALEADVWG
jgi:hypothetical protein